MKQQLAPQRDSFGMTAAKRESEADAAAARPPDHITDAAGPQALPPSPAAAAPPAEGLEDAQAGPDRESEPRRCGTAYPGRASRGFSMGMASAAASAPPDPDAGSSVAASHPGGTAQPTIRTCAWHPGARIAPYAAVAAPQQLLPVRGYVMVPWGYGGCGGSSGPPQAADPWRACGHPYGGTPLRQMYVNQRPLIANQPGPPTGVAGVHGSTGLGVGDGLRLMQHRLHSGQLPAATGMAAGTEGYGVAGVSGACGSVVAAGPAVTGAGNAPVGGPGADRQWAFSHGHRSGSAWAGSPLGPPAEDMRRRQPEVDKGWQQQGQDGEDMQRAGAQDEGLSPDEEVPPDEELPSEKEGSDGVCVPPPKRRRLQGQASGTGGRLRAPEQRGVQPSVLAPQQGAATERAALGFAAASAGSQCCYTVGHCGFHLDLPIAAVRKFWPQQSSRLKRSPGAANSIQVTLHTRGGAPPRPAMLAAGPAGMQEAVSGQHGEYCDEHCDELEEEHAVQLSCVSGSKFRLLKAEDVLVALGLRGEGVLQLRRTPDVRVWVEHVPGDAPCPRQLHAPAAEAQAWDVRAKGGSLVPPAAMVRRLWPQQAAGLKENLYPGHCAPVTLYTAACDGAPPAAAAGHSASAQQLGGEQWPTEQHTVLLHYTAAAKKYNLKGTAGIISAMGLRGGDMLRMRRLPDGRAWAERATPPDANPPQQQPAPALAASTDPSAAGTAAVLPAPSTTASALQQPDPGLAAASTSAVATAPATNITGIRGGKLYTSSSYNPCAPPAQSTDAPFLYSPAATSTTATTSSLRVSGGCLHLDRPTVAALWPECVLMPVGTQQLVRMRAVVEPGGGGNTAEEAAGGSIAGPRRSVTHYGTQLARLGLALWLLERTHALLRELRLGEGDLVQLVQLEGGVVGVRRAGAGEEEAAGQSMGSGDQAAAGAAGQKCSGCRDTGGGAGEAGSSIGGVMDDGGQGVGGVPAAPAIAPWRKGLVSAPYEEGLRDNCHVLPVAAPQQHDPQQGGLEQQRGQRQGDEGVQGLDQEQGKEQRVHIQRQGQGEQQDVYLQEQDRHELEGEQMQQEQVQQQDEQRLVQEQEAGGEQGQAPGPGERGQGREQDEVQRPQHHVGAAYADTCLTRQRGVEQRSALPMEPQRVSQVPRLDTGTVGVEQRQAQDASACGEAYKEHPSLLQQQVPYPRLEHQQRQEQLRQGQQCTGVTGTAGSSATENEWEMGVECIRGQGPQQQQRPAAAHLPASSLTPAHLHGCLPPRLAPPPPQSGELPLCGLTFHPDLAPGVRRAMADWEAGLGGTPLHEVEPEAGQVQVLEAEDAGAAAWGDAAGWSAALVQRHQLRRLVLTMELVRLLGLEEEEDWGRELPDHAPLRAGLERRRDEQRGGWGLWATGQVRKSHPIGVVGGYVMPAAAAKRFVELGWRDCSEGVKAEVRERVGGDGGRARVSYGWKLLASSYTMPYPAVEPAAQRFHPGRGRGGGASSSGSAVPPVLSTLGYGTPTALVNDPRVNPRAWQHGHDVDADREQLRANCGVVFVSVRGLVLPVLVALRDIAPGEQLLRDYGAAWWRDVAGVWEVAEDQGVAAEALWHGTGSNA